MIFYNIGDYNKMIMIDFISIIHVFHLKKKIDEVFATLLS